MESSLCLGRRNQVPPTSERDASAQRNAFRVLDIVGAPEHRPHFLVAKLAPRSGVTDTYFLPTDRFIKTDLFRRPSNGSIEVFGIRSDLLTRWHVAGAPATCRQ